MFVVSGLLSILLTTHIGSATPLPFVWDQGTERDLADRHDVILDVSKPCDSPEIAINIPGLLERPLPTLPVPDPDHTLSSFAARGVRLAPELGRLVQVFDENAGDGPLFILLPESHRAVGGEAEEARHQALMAMDTFFAAAVIEATTGTILNLREGVEGKIDRRDFALEGDDRFTQLWNQMQRVFGAPFGNLALIYQDEPRVHSSYVENGTAIAHQILNTFGDLDSAKNFEEALENVKRNYHSDPTAFLDLRPAYEHLRKLDRPSRESIGNILCIARGEQMAKRALELTAEKKPRAVFLGYGSSHHAEISTALRRAGKTFLALQPRLTPPE